MVTSESMTPDVQLICRDGACRDWTVNMFYPCEIASYGATCKKVRKIAKAHVKATGHKVVFATTHREVFK